MEMATFSQAVNVSKVGPQQYLYDWGKNHAGWPSLVLRGPPGATVRLVPGERLDETGANVSQSNSGSPMYWEVTLGEGGDVAYTPLFSTYGYRWLLVMGAKPAEDTGPGPEPAGLGSPVVVSLESRFVHSSLATVGNFSCSKALYNGLQTVVTDCPHRERLGWLEVPWLLAAAHSLNFDVSSLYSKVAQDTRESQLPESGLIPSIAPEYTIFDGDFRDSPEVRTWVRLLLFVGPLTSQPYRTARMRLDSQSSSPCGCFSLPCSQQWGAAAILVPAHILDWYGDDSALVSSYETVTRYFKYLQGRANDAGILEYGLGDWCDMSSALPTPQGLTATAVYFLDAVSLAAAARHLNRTEDAAYFEATAQDVRADFQKAFWDGKTFGSGSQVSLSMALNLGLAEEEDVQSLTEQLVARVRADYNHTTVRAVARTFVSLPSKERLCSGQQGDRVADQTDVSVAGR